MVLRAVYWVVQRRGKRKNWSVDCNMSDPGEESQAPLGSDAARGNQTVLDISSDSDIQDRLVAKNKKGVCLPHSTRNRQVLTGIHRRAGRPGPRKQ